jgi:hypothetical protein
MNNKIEEKVCAEALGITQGCPGFAAWMSIVVYVSTVKRNFRLIDVVEDEAHQSCRRLHNFPMKAF